MAELRSSGNTLWAASDLLVSFDGQRVLWRAADGELLVGRENPPAHVRIAHPSVSRLHARLIPGAPWRLVDYDSLNGIYLNGRRILCDLDVIDGMTVHLGHPDGVEVTFNYVAQPIAEVVSLAGAGRSWHEENTEALTDDIRRELINEAIVLSLDVVADELAQLPTNDGPRLTVQVNSVRARLARVDGLLSALSALGADDAAAAFGTVRGVYERLLAQSTGSGLAA